MRIVKGVSDCGHDLQHIFGWHPARVASPQQLSSVGAFHVVHRDPKLTFVFTAVMNGDHVRMPEGSGDVCFPCEPLAVLRVGAHTAGKNLQSFSAGQPWVLNQVDLAHPPSAQQAQDRVASKHCTIDNGHA
ncbi:hypothetical protein AWC13_09840 [Mycobacterium kubicae]|nr:hypothetical protein A5657_02925 [Mycobacterium kubicae]ORV99683.1 hypothetical protein AWC13_09840 [Mycobacterium kubicae]